MSGRARKLAIAASGRELLPPALTPARARALRGALRAWYAREGRELPWRESRDPYRVWISEAMLQQTRVEAVREHYRRFLERFPDLAALARAEEGEVLAAWSGLGYYRRARSLHAAARLLVERHDGRFPSEAAHLRELPGIGRYSAGAIASIAFERPEPVVDGNVARVFARLFALDSPPCAALERRLWRIAAELVPADGPGEWNQALMELGATVCTPRRPACEACPLAPCCEARRAGREQELPRPRSRPEPLAVELEMLVVERAGSVLVLERPPGTRMAGLWEPPTRELGPDPKLWPGRWPLEEGGEGALEAGELLGRLSHAITRHKIGVALRSGRLARGARFASPAAWIDPRRPERGLTGLARKAFAAWARDAGEARPSR